MLRNVIEPIRRYLSHDWIHIVIPAGVLLLTLIGASLVRRLLFRVIRRMAATATSQAGPILISTLRGPIMIWGLILGLHFATQTSELPPRALHYIAKSLFALWLISITIMVSQLVGNLVRHYGGRSNGQMPATSLTKSLAQIFVAVIGLLILLNHLGISITPLLATLGVGGLAVALALQDTLSNLFAGFYISIAGQVRLGDYIRLNSGEEGVVADISWRSTMMRTLGHNLIIVPNAKLGQAIITNFNFPNQYLAVQVAVGVGYDSDPDQVEAVLVDEAVRGVGQISGLLAEPAPNARLNPGFGDSALQFTLTVFVAEFAQQFAVQSEMRKRILKRLRVEKIDMPFPTRTVMVRQQPSQ
ncbi:MAG TPA: mechanosensitive ion channel family protein [Solibacterales bacterium]|nr:mechanosensitive ion channel family protein [Bryobacterales bacterium]